MQALIVHDELGELDRIGRALSRRGFMVITCTNQDEAVSLVRRSVTDLVILKDKIETRYTSAVALAAEYNNPQAVTFLLTERSRVQSFELFELVPSLHAVLSARPDAQLVAALGLQAVENPTKSTLVLSPHTLWFECLRDPISS